MSEHHWYNYLSEETSVANRRRNVYFHLHFNFSVSLIKSKQKRGKVDLYQKHCLYLLFSKKDLLHKLMLLPNKNIELHNTLMKTSAKVVLGLTAVVLLSLLISEGTQDLAPAPKRLLQTYTTTSTRTTNVNNLCPANLDRTTLVSSADKTAAQEQRTEVSNTLGIDGYFLNNVGINLLTMPPIAKLTRPLLWSRKTLSILAYLLLLLLLAAWSSSSYGPSSAVVAPALTAVHPSAAKKQKTNSTQNASSTGQQWFWSWPFAWLLEPLFMVKYKWYRFFKGEHLRTCNQSSGMFSSNICWRSSERKCDI